MLIALIFCTFEKIDFIFLLDLYLYIVYNDVATLKSVVNLKKERENKKMKKNTQKQEFNRKEVIKELRKNNLIVNDNISDYVLKKQATDFGRNFEIKLNDEEMASLNDSAKIVVMRECYLTLEITKNEGVYNVSVVNDFSVFEPKQKEISKRKQLEEENATLKEMIKQLQAQVKA